MKKKNCIFIIFLSFIMILSGWTGKKPEPISETHVSENEQPEHHSNLTVQVQKPVSFWRLQQEFPNIVVIRGIGNKIALTFDDGPSAKYTPQILNVLKKYNVKATFFMMGAKVSKYPYIVKRVAQEGHAIGNHTYWHPNLGKATVEQMKWEIAETEKALNKIVGIKPKLFRPPFGSLTREQTIELGKLNLTTVMWSVDSNDWKQLPAEQIKNNVLNHIHPGAVVLFHDGGHWTQDLSGTVEALELIIPKLQEDGFTFVTIPQLFHL
ncbi:polysaccharide deacetylase family protein [Bacillus aquiflavi]|uniref:Polysaccharide deacetylase family protein n=1 Tax=Bacillus aquiflavi TaxID=2672567 RepID=A0A6B3VX93_9BACI|nr:polysaccharide deacetylase family protein [Bacillus aquiflavi]MBA4538547.1 polysaccharide deacetylase family protein [Bacillus aquiflavi]NEY82910.1 polysaccharide deacetylase family protein [Bacillus aquiflavi]UAC49591.1 polysaccharide deacetylase family protein [Bacillus aquiflavi]